MGTITAQKNWTFPHIWELRFVHSSFNHVKGSLSQIVNANTK